ncbi:hypothetical protein J6S55_02550 [Candidatus Saccharibacteria bacterium]|nr:hypothetical protein [Candidatus Saccharibacteria bacterium]
MSNKIDMVDLEIIEKNNYRSLKILSGFLDLLFHVLVVIESGRGIFQVLLNHTDNPVYLTFVIPFLSLMSLSLGWYVLYISALFGKWVSLGYLVYARGIILDEMEEREQENKKQPVLIDLEKKSNIVDFCELKEIELIK